MPAEPWVDQLSGLQKSMFTLMRSDSIASFMIESKPRLQSMVLSMGTIRKYTDFERNKYMAPYADIERRRVLLKGPGPATMPKNAISVVENDFADVLNRNANALTQTDIPILLLTSNPGFIVSKDAIEYAKEEFKNLTVADVGAGKHFLPEDQPTAVGNAIRDWVLEKRLVSGSATITN